MAANSPVLRQLDEVVKDFYDPVTGFKVTMMQPQGVHFILHGLVNVTDDIVRYVWLRLLDVPRPAYLLEISDKSRKWSFEGLKNHRYLLPGSFFIVKFWTCVWLYFLINDRNWNCLRLVTLIVKRLDIHYPVIILIQKWVINYRLLLEGGKFYL